MTFFLPPTQPPSAPPSTQSLVNDPLLIDQRSGRPKLPSKKMRRVIALLATKKFRDISDAAKRVGLSRETCYRAFRQPHVANYMRAQVAGRLTAGTQRASARLLELVDAKSEHVSGDCARHVLAIDGFKPPEAGNSVNVTANLTAGYTIILDRGRPLPGAMPVIDEQGGPADGG